MYIESSSFGGGRSFVGVGVSENITISSTQKTDSARAI